MDRKQDPEEEEGQGPKVSVCGVEDGGQALQGAFKVWWLGNFWDVVLQVITLTHK